MQISIDVEESSDIFKQNEDKISDVCYMDKTEMKFLNSLVCKTKPIKIVELGVARGGSTILMLNAIKNLPKSKLFSIDYLDYLYSDNSKNVAYAVKERVPELCDKWSLRTGGLLCDFIDEIGNDIDLCMIDTMHINPGEILDVLMILPFMKKNGIIVFHDTSLHIIAKNVIRTTNCVLLSALKGEKILPNHFPSIFPNIGAIKLDENIVDSIFDIFNCLILPWSYKLSTKDVAKLSNFFLKTYGDELNNIFLRATDYYNSNDSQLEAKNYLDNFDIKLKRKSKIKKYSEKYKYFFCTTKKHYQSQYKKLKILFNVLIRT